MNTASNSRTCYTLPLPVCWPWVATHRGPPCKSTCVAWRYPRCSVNQGITSLIIHPRESCFDKSEGQLRRIKSTERHVSNLTGSVLPRANVPLIACRIFWVRHSKWPQSRLCVYCAHLIQHGSLAFAPRLAWGQFLKHSGAASCTAPKNESAWHFFETILSTEWRRQVQLAGGFLCRVQSPYESGEYQYLVGWCSVFVDT